MEEDQYDVYRPSVMLFSVFLPTLDSVQSFVISCAVCADAAAVHMKSAAKISGRMIFFMLFVSSI